MPRPIFPFRRQATLWKDSIQSPLGVFGFVSFCLRVIFFYTPSSTFNKGSYWTRRAIEAAASLLIFPEEPWIATELCLYAHPA